MCWWMRERAAGQGEGEQPKKTQSRIGQMTDKGACRGEGKQANVGKVGRAKKKKKKNLFEGRERVAPGHQLTCPRVKWFSKSKRKKP